MAVLSRKLTRSIMLFRNYEFNPYLFGAFLDDGIWNESKELISKTKYYML